MAARLAYRILVLGGYGQFGSRIVRTLAGGPDCHIIIAGRHSPPAKALIASLGTTAASVSSLVLNTTAADLSQQLQE